MTSRKTSTTHCSPRLKNREREERHRNKVYLALFVKQTLFWGVLCKSQLSIVILLSTGSDFSYMCYFSFFPITNRIIFCIDKAHCKDENSFLLFSSTFRSLHLIDVCQGGLSRIAWNDNLVFLLCLHFNAIKLITVMNCTSWHHFNREKK